MGYVNVFLQRLETRRLPIRIYRWTPLSRVPLQMPLLNCARCTIRALYRILFQHAKLWPRCDICTHFQTTAWRRAWRTSFPSKRTTCMQEHASLRCSPGTAFLRTTSRFRLCLPPHLNRVWHWRRAYQRNVQAVLARTTRLLYDAARAFS